MKIFVKRENYEREDRYKQLISNDFYGMIQSKWYYAFIYALTCFPFHYTWQFCVYKLQRKYFPDVRPTLFEKSRRSKRSKLFYKSERSSLRDIELSSTSRGQRSFFILGV